MIRTYFAKKFNVLAAPHQNSPRVASTGAANLLVYVAAARHCVLAWDVFWDLEHGWLIRDVAATA